MREKGKSCIPASNFLADSDLEYVEKRKKLFCLIDIWLQVLQIYMKSYFQAGNNKQCSLK